MGLSAVLFYVALAFQLFGITAVGLCLFAGISNGDYGRIELAQFIGGSVMFYFGTYLKNKSSST